jgi:hypothetical protein
VGAVWLSLLLLLLLAPPFVHSQGLVKNPDAIVAANNAYISMRKQIEMGQQWRKELRSNPIAACSSNNASLCSPNPEMANNMDPDLTAFWATVPPSYDQLIEYGG